VRAEILERLHLIARGQHARWCTDLARTQAAGDGARRLATKPHLLLLDEIAGGLTEGGVPRTRRDHQASPRHGEMTIIWIEHIVHGGLLAVAGRLECIEFRKGKKEEKVAEGDPQEG